MQQILNKAANGMGGKWIIKFSSNKDKQQQIDKVLHDGRQHELKCYLTMEYIPAENEKKQIGQAIDLYYKAIGKREPTAAEKLNDPTLNYFINVTAVINAYDFTPFDLQKAASLGGSSNIPGTVSSIFRTKELGTGTPYYSLYIGDYKQTNINGVENLTTNLPALPECTNVRTIHFEVHSNLAVARDFISKLDLAAINRMIQEL